MVGFIALAPDRRRLGAAGLNRPVAAGRWRLGRSMIGRLMAGWAISGWALGGGLLAPPALAQETRYGVTLVGVEDEALGQLLQDSSTLFRLKDQAPPSPVGLERRADADRERLATTLRSAGHYAGTIDIAINETAEPVAVTITVTPGAEYRFSQVLVAGADGRPLLGGAIDQKQLGLDSGAPARAPAVVAGRTRVEAALAERGYAYARVIDQRVVVDHGRRSMDVTYLVDAGPEIRFGRVSVVGLEEVEEPLVRGRVAWRTGEPYRPALLEKTRTQINKLGAFGSVQVKLAEAPDADGSADVTITVTERKRRLIGAGVTFSTAEGLGGQLYWGHRNLFGGAEQLRIGAEVARLNTQTVAGGAYDRADYRLVTDFQKPDFLIPDQSLLVNTSVISERPIAYDRNALLASAKLERLLEEGLTVGYGVSAEQSRIVETGVTTEATIFGVPLTGTYDATDDKLDPTKGFRVALETTPYLQTGDNTGGFVIGRIGASAYHDFSADGSTILAARFAVGAIANGARRDLPADKRFYAGGGGSIRGFAYQKAGPLDANGDPVGGKSLVEFGVEGRIKVTDTIGVVPFVDGGNVYDTALPEFGQEPFLGAGLGLRYYTDFGPLRVDLGVPLNPRTSDESWQLYMSLGQAF